MASILNVKIGRCDVSYNGVDLGHTLDGVEVSYEPEYKDVSVDKYGSTIVNKYIIGEKLTAKVKLAEFTIANLKIAMPQGSFAGAANTRLLLGHSAGVKATDTAAQLVLHPSNEGTRIHDIVIYKAYVGSAVVIPMKNDEEKMVEVTFEALIDETKSDGNYLGMIGDSTT